MLGILRQFAICVRSRLSAAFTYSLSSVVGLLVASRGIPPPPIALALPLSISFVILSIYLYNDICDVEDDRRSARVGKIFPSMRPLQSGRVPRRTVAGLVFLSASMGLVLALMVNGYVLLLEALLMALGLVYSTEPIRLKRRLFIKNAMASTGFTISILTGGFAVCDISWRLIYLAAIYIVLSIGVIPVRDFRDVEEDRLAGIKTLPVVWGPEATVRFSIALIASTALATVVGYSRIGFNVALPVLGSIIFASLIYVIYPLRERWSDKIYLNRVVYRRLAPLNLALQATIVVASLPLPI